MKAHRINTLAIIIAFALLPLTAAAQKQVYHNVGDTMYTVDSIYFNPFDWNEWLDEDITHNLRTAMIIAWKPYFEMNGIVLRKFQTDKPIKIVGLATASKAGLGTHIELYDSTLFQEYLLLYDAQPDTFVKLAEIPFQPTDPKRYLNIPIRSLQFMDDNGYPLDGCCGTILYEYNNYVVPIHEYYFDKPITVNDSFYLGTTEYSNFNDVSVPTMNEIIGIAGDAALVWSHHMMINFFLTTYINYCPDSCPVGPMQMYKLYKIRNYNGWTLIENPHWEWVESDAMMVVFPIIEIDTTQPPAPPFECVTPGTPYLLGQFDDCASIAWNGHASNTSWEVSLTPSGCDPDSGTISYCSNTLKTLCGMESNVHYAAYVRAVCLHDDSTWYSDWSDSLGIFIQGGSNPGGDTNSGDTTRVVSPRQTTIEVVPNPADGMVRVTATTAIGSVAVYDMKGRKVEEPTADGTTAVFNVTSWPRGVYLVVALTDTGTATQRLVVQ